LAGEETKAAGATGVASGLGITIDWGDKGRLITGAFFLAENNFDQRLAFFTGREIVAETEVDFNAGFGVGFKAPRLVVTGGLAAVLTGGFGSG